MSASTPLKLWQGDDHLLRLNIDEVNNGVSTGDLNLASIESFTYAIGEPRASALVNRTYTKAEVIEGAESGGNVLIPIVGTDTESIPPSAYYLFQVWMTDTDGKEYTIFERELDLRDKLRQ